VNLFSDIINNHALLEQVVLGSLGVIIIILCILTAIFSYRAEKFEQLYNYTNKEARLLARLKTTYENELRTFAGLMDEITFPIWQRDKNLNIIYCNSRYCEVTGEIRENIIKKSNTELFRDAKDFAQKVMKTGQTQVMEQNIVISGSNTLSQIVEIPTSDSASKFSSKGGTIGFALNLAELQSTRERLKFNVELQKRLLESLNEAVAIYGINQRLEYYNKSFVDLWKLDEDFLKTYPTYGELLEYLRQKRRLPEQANFAAFKKENVQMFTNLISKKEDFYYLTDGRILKVVIIPYQNRGLLFYYDDLTNAISLERSYNTLVSVQKQTLDNLNDAVAVFREDGRLELYNPIFRNLWGFTESFLKSEPHISQILEEFTGMYSPEVEMDYHDRFMEIINGRYPATRTTKRLDNITLLERFTPLPDGATLIIFSDITDKANLEKSIIAEKKAYEEADKIKSSFLSNVSYELRSPLTSIMGFSEILLSLYAKKMDKKVQEYINDILDSSEKLKMLIDNIIDVSSIDAGFVSIDPKEMNITEFIDPLLKELKADADKKSVNVSMDVKKDVEVIIVDRQRLSHSIRTLFNQAIDMSKPGGTVKLNVSKHANKVRFEIADDGAGISEMELKTIFEQFYKLKSDKIGAGGGNIALALYLSKKIIDLHGGNMDISSTPNKGTKFIFEIPSSYI